MYGYQPQPRAITRPLPPGGLLFPTTWPNTENPVSQGGIWTQAGTTGLDWQNTKSTGGAPGTALGTGTSSGFDDCISSVQGRFSTTKHFAQVTISLTAGYTPPSSHEVETWIGLTITAHNLAGYELSLPFGGSLQPVRSNGPIGNFDTGVFTTLSGATFAAGDADIIKAIFDSTSGSPVITIFLNSVQQWQITDTTAGKITTGSPGMGFFIRPGAGADPTKYCNKGYDCGNA